MPYNQFVVYFFVRSVHHNGYNFTIRVLKRRAFNIASARCGTNTFCFGFYKFSNHQKLQYQSYAAKYAGTNQKNKSHKYWVDIGNYMSLDSHNAEHLRWRQIDDIYDYQYDWNWKSQKHMKKFEEMRIRSDKLSKYGEYTIGIITLNHIISAINSLYLSRMNENVKIYSLIEKNKIKIQLRYDI